MIHFVFQGKGGCGKTTVASYLCQYFYDKGEKTVPFDVDPINTSLASIEDLKVEVFKIMEKDNFIMRNFDTMIENLLALPKDTQIIIDTGASSFQPITKYMHEGQVYSLLAEHHDIVVHSPVVGGAAAEHTFVGFGETICERTSEEVKLVIWLNDFFGSFEEEMGVKLEKTPVYEKYKDRIAGVVRLRKQPSQLHDEDLAEMNAKKYTFAQAEKEMMTMPRLRLQGIKKAIYNEIDLVMNQLSGKPDKV